MRFIWPTPQQEDWRYTNVSKLSNFDFSLAEEAPPQILPQSWQEFLGDEFDSSLIFWNGNYCERLSKLSGQFKFSQSKKYEFTPATELEEINQSLIKHIESIEISKSLRRPIALIFLNSSDVDGPQIRGSRLRVKLSKFAEASIVEIHAGMTHFKSQIENHISEVILEEASRLEHIFLNVSTDGSQSFFKKECELSKLSFFKSLHIDLGGDLSRTDTHVCLNGAGSEAVVNGVYLNEAKQHTDHMGIIRHNAPETLSHQLFKGILTDQSRAVFNAKVRIEQSAPKANAEQLNKNLLLSSKAEIDSLPRLEIFNDDVKATHGSAFGQIDKDQIFYLVSRGIPRTQAVQMLVEAYAFEMLENISPVIAQKIAPMLSLKLKNFKSEDPR